MSTPRSLARTVRTALTLALALALVAALPSVANATVSGTASVDVKDSFLGKSSETYIFTVNNTSNAGEDFGSVRITRPSGTSNQWGSLNGGCATSRTNWTAASFPTSGGAPETRHRSCDFKQGTGTAILDGTSQAFTLTLPISDGATDASLPWIVEVSTSTGFTTAISTATASSAGALDSRLWSFEITDAIVQSTSGIVGAPCPPADKSAPATSTQTVVICGRAWGAANRTAPNAANSDTSLSGTMLLSGGAFSGAFTTVPNTLSVLANYTGATITDQAGSGKDIVVERVGNATNQKSPPPSTTLAGYEATHAATTLTNVSGSGTYGDTATLTATLASGSALSGKTVAFELNDTPVGTAVTDASGEAELTGVSLVGIDADSYDDAVEASFAQDATYAASNGAGDLTVDQRDTSGSIVAANKTYDNTPAAVLTTRTVDNRVGTDDVTLDGAAAFDDENVGTRTASIAAPSLGGTDAGNYNLTGVGTDDADITKAMLDVDAANKSKTYGDSEPTFTWTYSGFATGDNDTNSTITGSANCSRDAGESVAGGPYTITCTAGAPGNLSAPNYDFQQGDTGQLTIGKAMLDVDAVADSKTYGDSEPTLDWTYSGFKFSDDDTNSGITGSANCSRTAGETVAGSPYTITCTAGAPGNLAAPNYDFQQGDTAAFTIGKRDTTGSITADTKVYDGTTAATLTSRVVDSRVGTDDVTLDGAAAFDDKNVGTQTASIAAPSLGGTDAGNYNLTTVGTDDADITKAMLDVNADDKSKTYGTSDPTPTWTYSGFGTGDNATNSSISGDPDCSRAAGSAVGSYAITCLEGTLAAPNYDFQEGAPGQLTITKKNVTGSFSATDKVYNGTAAASASGKTVNGELAGDTVTLTGGTAAFNNANAGTGKTVTLSGATLGGTHAANYNLTSVGTTTADITKKSVTGQFTAADKDFDGTKDATITGRSLTGAIAGDDVSLSGGVAGFVNEGPGVDISVLGFSFTLAGSDAGNYTLSSVDPTTATINQRGPGGQDNPPTEEELEQGASDALGGDVKPLGTDFGDLAFGFAPGDQGRKLAATKQPLFAIGCVADCDVNAKKTVVLTTGDGGASAAATKKLKLRPQNMSLAEGEVGVIKLKLSKKQKRQIKKAKKAKLIIKTTVESGGETAADKKTYRLKT